MSDSVDHILADVEGREEVVDGVDMGDNVPLEIDQNKTLGDLVEEYLNVDDEESLNDDKTIRETAEYFKGQQMSNDKAPTQNEVEHDMHVDDEKTIRETAVINNGIVEHGDVHIDDNVVDEIKPLVDVDGCENFIHEQVINNEKVIGTYDVKEAISDETQRKRKCELDEPRTCKKVKIEVWVDVEEIKNIEQTIEIEEKRKLTECLKQMVLDLTVVESVTQPPIKILGEIMWIYLEFNVWNKLSNAQKHLLMNRMQNVVKFKQLGRGLLKGNSRNILKFLSEYKRLVGYVTFSVSKVKFNKEITIEEEKNIFKDVLSHANIKKQYNDRTKNYEYGFGNLSIKQFEIFVNKFS